MTERIALVILLLITASTAGLNYWQRDARQPAQTQQGTLSDFRDDPELWRSYYGNFTGTVEQFAGADGKRYRTPFTDYFAPYRELVREELHGGRVLSLPRDGDKLHLTIIYRKRDQDPASMHVANMFTRHQWLNWFLNAAHFSAVTEGEARYSDFLAQYIPPNRLPAVLIQEPAGNDMDGEVLFFAPADQLTTNADVLAVQIAQQLEKYQRSHQAQLSAVELVWHDPFRIHTQSEPVEPLALEPVLPTDIQSPASYATLAVIVAVALLIASQRRKA